MFTFIDTENTLCKRPGSKDYQSSGKISNENGTNEYNTTKLKIHACRLGLPVPAVEPVGYNPRTTSLQVKHRGQRTLRD